MAKLLSVEIRKRNTRLLHNARSTALHEYIFLMFNTKIGNIQRLRIAVSAWSIKDILAGAANKSPIWVRVNRKWFSCAQVKVMFSSVRPMALPIGVLIDTGEKIQMS
jgi:hypothetical protein